MGKRYASELSPKTRMHYRQLLNKHILPSLGSLELQAIRPETIGRWQVVRIAPGYGRVSARYALTLREPKHGVRSTNGLLHQSSPRTPDLAQPSGTDLAAVAGAQNHRPRRTLDRQSS